MFFRAIGLSTEQCQTLLVITFLTFYAPSYFLITNMHVATEEFFSVMHSCCCLTGLGLGLNILVLFPSLTQIRVYWPWCETTMTTPTTTAITRSNVVEVITWPFLRLTIMVRWRLFAKEGRQRSYTVNTELTENRQTSLYKCENITWLKSLQTAAK